MKKILTGMLFLIASFGVFAQDTIKHTVVKDDTVMGLARKYGVSVHDIYQLNPQSKEGIKLGETLLIPSTAKNKPQLSGKYQEHKVEAKETLFGIAQKYGVTLQAIQEANPNLQGSDIEIGMLLNIPTSQKSKSVTTTVVDSEILHVVAPKETVFALTQRYGISKEALEANNPQITQGLKIGDTIKIPTTKQAITSTEKPVQETITKVDTTPITSGAIKSSSRKKVVLLLPFNTSKQNLETKAIQESFKKSSFMNIVVDFYAGAKLAVDHVNNAGGNFDVYVYDSEETTNNSNVEQIIRENNFSDVDVVIGPFFQAHAERAAQLLSNGKTIVVSPLSKEGKANHKNLFLSVPSSDITKKAMLDFLKAKGQNTVAIVDRKKQNSKDFIASNFSGISFVGFNEKGGINTDQLKGMLTKGRTNYVILETESTSMVINVVSILNNLKGEYDIKLVTLDKNDAFESDEVPSSRLAGLHFHFPSYTKDMTMVELPALYAEYKAVNNVMPSQFALRGYDVVYDVLYRLSQGQSLYDTTSQTTQQADSKFTYVKSPDGGYYNKGTYILYYDTDLTLKLAE